MATTTANLNDNPDLGEDAEKAWSAFKEKFEAYPGPLTVLADDSKNRRPKYCAKVVLAFTDSTLESAPISKYNEAKAKKTEKELQDAVLKHDFYDTNLRLTHEMRMAIKDFKAEFPNWAKNPLLSLKVDFITEMLSAYENEELCLKSEAVFKKYELLFKEQVSTKKQKKKQRPQLQVEEA